MLMAVLSGAFIGTFIAIAVLGHVLLLDAIFSAPEHEADASPSPARLSAITGVSG
jgi:hypothetical protein